jgi:hypothetical protein
MNFLPQPSSNPSQEGGKEIPSRGKGEELFPSHGLETSTRQIMMKSLGEWISFTPAL